MTFSLMNNIGYIFIVRRLGKQSKLILSRSDSISNLKLNLRIHGPSGPNAHAGADLQVFLIFCFKPILFSAHKLILLIYGDNSSPQTARVRWDAFLASFLLASPPPKTLRGVKLADSTLCTISPRATLSQRGTMRRTATKPGTDAMVRRLNAPSG